ncbi:AMIN-like domain-containing (lipo)protein [Georgenia daeguensis]|uniref:AMIN-like domain-containing protein n=1 Tax=Georgenia daeguensis TaxID=908355 RepID=A0ABP8ETP6_9MICO
MRRSARVVMAALAGGALLAACSNGGEEPAPAEPATSSPTSGESASPTPSATGTDDDGSQGDDGATAAPAEETDEPADAADFGTEPQNDPDWPSGGSGDLLPTGVRVGSHEGYERVVLDFEGTGTPGWRVEYVDEAVEDPKGDVVDVQGDVTLQVIATGVRYPEGDDETGRVAQGSYDAEDADLVEEVRVTGMFEGQNQAFIGLDEKAPFRVFTLTEPARLVVDVRTTDG